jgi:hypothetical protein
MIAGIRRPLRAAARHRYSLHGGANRHRSDSRPDSPSEFGEVKLLAVIGKAFAGLWVAWLAAAAVAFLAWVSGLLSPVAALAVGLTLAVIFMAIGLLRKE